jgi:predicted transcriptional regulator of viral defense system
MHKRGSDAARSWAKYHSKMGRLRSLERGLYAAVPPEAEDPRRFVPDLFLTAAAARPEGIVAYHGALELLGAAHSIWTDLVVITLRRRKPLRIGPATIAFVQPPVALGNPKKRHLGTVEVPYRGKPLTVTGPERTLVEGFRFPRLVGGLAELVESAAGFATLDFTLLDGILRAYQQKTLFAGVGWFLERYRQHFYVPEDVLRRLARRRPTSPQYLPREQRRKGGAFVKRWNLVLPEEIVRLAEPNEG